MSTDADNVNQEGLMTSKYSCVDEETRNKRVSTFKKGESIIALLGENGAVPYGSFTVSEEAASGSLQNYLLDNVIINKLGTSCPGGGDMDDTIFHTIKLFLTGPAKDVSTLNNIIKNELGFVPYKTEQ